MSHLERLAQGVAVGLLQLVVLLRREALHRGLAQLLQGALAAEHHLAVADEEGMRGIQVRRARLVGTQAFPRDPSSSKWY